MREGERGERGRERERGGEKERERGGGKEKEGERANVARIPYS